MPRILLAGVPGDYTVGGHFDAAARSLGVELKLVDLNRAYGTGFFQKAFWRIASHRPYFLRRFGSELLDESDRFRPDLLLTTGLGPVSGDVLAEFGKRGVLRAAFLTDDPFNPLFRRDWMLRQLAEYDCVFTPRRSNEDDLRRAGAKRVERLMFGFNPQRHLTPPDPPDERLASDIVFVGGADKDRVPILSGLIQSGFGVALYGNYWERYPETRGSARGNRAIAEINRATAAAKMTLILVRRSNRDGHVMRTFEAAAGRNCLLVERTEEHLEIYGPDGDCVRYFDGDGVPKGPAAILLGDTEERERLAEAVHRRITKEGKNTYGDRLREIMDLCMGSSKACAIHPSLAPATGVTP